MRRVTAIALVVVTLVTLMLWPGIGGPDGDRVDDEPAPELVTVGDAKLWPYVAPVRSFDRRASSTNVVVRTDPGKVRRYLAGDGAWNETDEEWSGGTPDDAAVLADETVPWRDAPGAARYTYVAGRGWFGERYQLHRGTYFGSRYHLRAYGSPDGNWTVIQAHAEHWDWFTITHTVDSVEHAQRRVESRFLGKARFEVRRAYHGNDDTYDADGWTTVVVLALTPLLAGTRLRSVARRVRGHATGRNRRRAALAGGLAALPLVVRFGGVLFERYLPWLSPDAVVALWYPVLVVGVPLVAYGFGRRLSAEEAGVLAAVGLGTGLVLDYAYLGVAVLPIPVAVHRVAVVAAVGLVAAGSRTPFRWTSGVRTGVLLWFGVVILGNLV